jgi:proteasome assembly chaperone (PAC2) family protein
LSKSIPCTFYDKPKLRECSLLVCWNEDAGKLGPKVINYLNNKLQGQFFCEIEPESFFSLGGVLVEHNVAQFPESKFYYFPDHELIALKSSSPRTEWYKFLNTIIDVVEQICTVKELYTIGSMVTFTAHTMPRLLFATVNYADMKTTLSQYNVATDMNYETPPGQRPTISSYLLWIAGRRNIMGAALWVPVPFYLLSTDDTKACRKTTDFFNRKFNLNIDLSDFDEKIHRQNVRLAGLANQYPELDNLFHKLENNVTLTDEENNRLVQLIEENLGSEL